MFCHCWTHFAAAGSVLNVWTWWWSERNVLLLPLKELANTPGCKFCHCWSCFAVAAAAPVFCCSEEQSFILFFAAAVITVELLLLPLMELANTPGNRTIYLNFMLIYGKGCCYRFLFTCIWIMLIRWVARVVATCIFTCLQLNFVENLLCYVPVTKEMLPNFPEIQWTWLVIYLKLFSFIWTAVCLISIHNVEISCLALGGCPIACISPFWEGAFPPYTS